MKILSHPEDSIYDRVEECIELSGENPCQLELNRDHILPLPYRVRLRSQDGRLDLEERFPNSLIGRGGLATIDRSAKVVTLAGGCAGESVYISYYAAKLDKTEPVEEYQLVKEVIFGLLQRSSLYSFSVIEVEAFEGQAWARPNRGKKWHVRLELEEPDSDQ